MPNALNKNSAENNVSKHSSFLYTVYPVRAQTSNNLIIVTKSVLAILLKVIQNIVNNGTKLYTEYFLLYMLNVF